MMSFAAFASAVLALLLSPGPTNVLMALAGAQGGRRRVLLFVPAALAGYLAVVVPLAWLGAEMLGRWPLLAVGLKLAAAAWVMVLAVRLWGLRGAGDRAGGVTAGRVLVTTMLNPKALIFGLVLLPAPADEAFLPKLLLFCLMVMGVSLVWGSAGTIAQGGQDGASRLQVIRRVASVWLAFVSITLIAGVLRV